ncbi:MAG: hypothetical protein HY913_18615 [Desulfomonile tiedjei]|nr:hypothetical protein [Desulfomonile tiedjei]
MVGAFETVECSRCGSRETVASRIAAAGAETWWVPEFKSFVPGRVPLPIKTKDAVKIWQLRLCENCVSKAFADFLAFEKSRTKKYIKTCLLLILLGIFGFALLYYLQRQQWDLATGIMALIMSGGLLPFGQIIVGGCFVGGILGVPVMIIRYIMLTLKLRSIDISTGTTPEKTIDKAFRGEAEKILQEPENSIPVPKYLDYNQLAYGIKTRTNGKVEKRQRLVLGVANSLEEIRNRVPRHWLAAVDEELLPTPEEVSVETQSESTSMDDSSPERLLACPACAMFLQRRVAQCPHCGAAIRE